MTLEDLMGAAFDETWFRIETGKKKHIDVWNADYIGGYEPTLEELEPFLGREVEEFHLKTIKNPERPRSKTPCIFVYLLEED